MSIDLFENRTRLEKEARYVCILLLQTNIVSLERDAFINGIHCKKTTVQR